MWDNFLKKVKDTVFGQKPTVLNNILFNEKKTVPLRPPAGRPSVVGKVVGFGPKEAREKPFSLISPLASKPILSKVGSTPKSSAPKIGTSVGLSADIARKISLGQQEGFSNYRPQQKVMGIKSTPTPTITPTPVPNKLDWKGFKSLLYQEAKARGYDPETLIRQKALETGFGTSNFALERNNYGGIGAYDRNPDNAFKFDTPQDYLDYYFTLIRNRYPSAYANRKNPQKYVQELKKGGYASDPDYEWKILNTPLDR